MGPAHSPQEEVTNGHGARWRHLSEAGPQADGSLAGLVSMRTFATWRWGGQGGPRASCLDVPARASQDSAIKGWPYLGGAGSFSRFWPSVHCLLEGVPQTPAHPSLGTLTEVCSRQGNWGSVCLAWAWAWVWAPARPGQVGSSVCPARGQQEGSQALSSVLGTATLGTATLGTACLHGQQPPQGPAVAQGNSPGSTCP